MPPPGKPTRPSYHGSGRDSAAPPSNSLWVGNLTGDVTDEVLLELFRRFEPLDATSYGSRGYGFIFFRRTEDAVAAKDSLQGAELKGSSINIEFARPVCAHLLIELLLDSYAYLWKYFYVLIDNRFCIFDLAIEIIFWISIVNFKLVFLFHCVFDLVLVNFHRHCF